MIISVFLLIISFLLDGIIPSIITHFIPFFSLSSIIFLSFLINDKNKYFIISIIYGLMYDLFYFPTIIISSFIFFLVSLLSYYIIKDKYNFFILLLFYFVIINLYLLFMIIFLNTSLDYNINYLIHNILSSLLINYLFFILLFFIIFLLKKIKAWHINELGDSL